MNVTRALRHPRHAGFIAYLITYHTAHNGACWDATSDLSADVVGLSAQRPRSATPPVLPTYPTVGERGAAGATIVPAKARSIRLTFRSGRTAEYALEGPLYPGIPDRRIFMADIGRERLPVIPKASGIELTY
jgi:hypothetical protein